MEALGYLTIYWVFCAFAVYRVARMVALEEGPLGLFDKWRDAIGKAAPDSWLSRGVNCPYCLSFWLALPAALWLATGGVQALVLWFSLAGGASYLQATEGEP